MSTKEKSTKNWFNIKQKRCKIFFVFFLTIKGMSEKTLKFDNIRVNKKESHKSKQPMDLKSVNVDQIAEYLANLSIVTKALNILLVTKKMKLLNYDILFYLK